MKNHSSSHSVPLIFQTNTRNTELRQSSNTPCPPNSPFQYYWERCTDVFLKQS